MIMNSTKAKPKNFHCPKCNCYTVITTSKRNFFLGNLRYRECRNCSYVFKTLENNSVEEFYPGVRKKSVRFTTDDIKQIRSLYQQGRSCGSLANKFKCSYTSIFRVVNFKVHKYVT